MNAPAPPNAVRLGSGAVANLVHSHDWSTSALGEPSTWSQELCTVASLIFNSKFPMFVAWGPDLCLLYNDAYTEMLANKHPAALGQPFRQVWPDIWDHIAPIVDQALQGESSFYENLPLTMQRKGYEEQTWFTFSYSPVFDHQGQVAGMYCACTETTQQVLAERHRVDENERMRQLFQQAPGIMTVVRHRDHVFELANDAYYRLIGHRQIIGKPVREALPEVEGQGLFELLDRVFNSGEAFIGRAVPLKLRRRPGDDLEERFVDFIYQPIRDGAGNVSGIFVEGSDVTDAVKVTQALRDSEQRLRQLANTIPHLAWMANADGTIHWYNDRWYEFTGAAGVGLDGWGWQNLRDPNQLADARRQMQESLATGTPFEVKAPLRSASGQYRIFYTRAAPLRDAAGEIVQWFGTNTDIHEIEKAQDELRSANRRKDEFLAMLAHELRNPLAPISSAAELLKVAALDPEQIRKTSEIIARQAAHMTELVDDLLDVSRVTRGLVTLHSEPLNLKAIVADALEQVSAMVQAKRQQLQVEMPDENAWVEGDRTRLTQILSNILNNATKYTPELGHISLRLELHDEQVEILVKDDGIGIDVRLLPHLFELFTQAERSPDRAQGGLGLGLALVKSLVELHGGSVTAKSAGPGKGSTVAVRLPRFASEPPPEQALPDGQESGSTALSIMVVDDNVDAAQTLAMLLELHGHTALVEYNGSNALQRLRETMPQVMILDIGLPDMDGFELAARIRALPEAANTSLIALTGYGQEQDRDQSRGAGFTHHLVKPVNAQELFTVLDEAGRLAARSNRQS